MDILGVKCRISFLLLNYPLYVRNNWGSHEMVVRDLNAVQQNFFDIFRCLRTKINLSWTLFQTIYVKSLHL